MTSKSVKFIANDFQRVTIESDEMDIWTEQCDLFFQFLLAQGFILSERDVAAYFTERADEMKNYRSNNREAIKPIDIGPVFVSEGGETD